MLVSGGGATTILELTREEQLVRSYLERALEGGSSTVLRFRLVNRFATEIPDHFCNAALTLLDAEADFSTRRFMIANLLRQPRLMNLLSDPNRLEKNTTIRLFRLLMEQDRSLDIRLARSLPDRYGASPQRLTLPACERALDVLDEVSEGRRIVPILAHLVDHPLPRLSAKATLIVGKRVQSADWVKRVLAKDRNPRERANALESLWGLDTPAARNLLWDHFSDKNNRVTGNAVFGLHVVGESAVPPAIERMAQRIEAQFRWTSAWLMAKTGRDEHLDRLKAMIKDENPGVRRAVLNALIGIRREQALKEAEEQRIARVCEKEADEPLTLVEPVAEAEPEPEPELQVPEPDLIEMPEFNLRLDGRSFSFRKK